MTAERERVVAEARRWIGTPYHHRASILGVGVDCAQLLLQAFSGAGLVSLKPADAGEYTQDWHMHRGEERYLAFIEQYARLVDQDFRSITERGKGWQTKMGNVLMWKVGRTYSHSAIVSDWPNIIHSYLPSRIVEEVDVIGTPMSRVPMRVYSLWGD